MPSYNYEMKCLVLLLLSYSLFVSSVSGFVITTNATYIYSYAKGADFHNWLMDDASFYGGNFMESDFTYSGFYDTDITNSAAFDRSDFSYSVFSNVVIRDSRFIDVIFKGANLANTLIDNVNFTGADLRNTDLLDLQIEGASNFDGTMLYGAILPVGYDQAYFEALGADFTTVPEPSSYALLLGSLALGLVAIRRR
jgi:uncharacterized protein YjbI with pentapeptide repeats